MPVKKALVASLLLKDSKIGRRIFEMSPNPVFNYWFGKKIIRNSTHASPDFIVAGTAKSGTTSLFQYLVQHPFLLPPTIKEIKYFGKRDSYRGLQWYLSHFPLKKDKGEKLTFEVETDYLFYKNAIPRIARLFPDIKLIAVLRDPVKKAFSHWNDYSHSDVGGGRNRLRHQIENRTFEVAVQEELENPSNVWSRYRYLAESRYSEQVRRCFDYYAPEKVLLLDFQELKTDPKTFLKKITDFLGVAPVYESFSYKNEKLHGHLFTKDQDNKKEIKQYNITPYKESLKPETEQRLRDYFAPYDEELMRLTGKKFSWME